MSEQPTPSRESAPYLIDYKKLLIKLKDDFMASIAPALENYTASQPTDKKTTNQLIEAMDAFRDKLDTYGEAATENAGITWNVIDFYNTLAFARRVIAGQESPYIPKALANLQKMKTTLEDACKN